MGGAAERINLDTVSMERSPDTGATRVLGTASTGEAVLLGFLERVRTKWTASTCHHATIARNCRTRQEALLRLVESHAGNE